MCGRLLSGLDGKMHLLSELQRQADAGPVVCRFLSKHSCVNGESFDLVIRRGAGDRERHVHASRIIDDIPSDGHVRPPLGQIGGGGLDKHLPASSEQRYRACKFVPFVLPAFI